MPELPEVETIRRGLQPYLVNKEIIEVTIRCQTLRYPLPLDIEAHIINNKIHRLERRAKYMLWHFSCGSVLVCHLGMSGRFMIYDRASRLSLHAHDHVIFYTDEGKEIRYRDPRRFGFMKFMSCEQAEAFALGKKLGPEPLSDAFTGIYLYQVTRGKGQGIKPFLLNQKYIAGLGNIYVCEALFRAKIHPYRLCHELTEEECHRLSESIKNVLLEAIKGGGTTLKDYCHPDGSLGYFQHHFKVYDREGQPCMDCHVSLILRQPQAGRSSFFCNHCQQ